MCRQSVCECARRCARRRDTEGLDVDVSDGERDRVALLELQPPDRQGRSERRAGRWMSTQPSRSGRWAPFISPQRPLPSVPSHRSGSSRSRNNRNWRTCHVGRQANHVGDRLAPDLAGRRPALVLPAQVEGLVAVVVPALPARGVAVGGERTQRGSHDRPGYGSDHRRRWTPPQALVSVIACEDALYPIGPLPAPSPIDVDGRLGLVLAPRGGGRGGAAVRQQRRRRLRGASRRPGRTHRSS